MNINTDNPNEPNDSTPANEPRRLTRTRDGRMIAGVCSGLARYFNADPTIVRIGVAAITLITSGAGVLFYVAAVLIVPDEGKELSIAQELINKQTGQRTDQTKQPH